MTKKKILVVDDEIGFTQLLVDYFKPLSYEIKAATNLEDALNVFRNDKPKVVLLDFNMPLVTGEQFLPLLQNVDPMVRVIIITGHIAEEVEEKFKGLGYYAFFKKGDLSLEQLRAKVDEALSY